MSDEDINSVAAHCPRCGAEYRPGFERCSDCGAALVRGPAPDPANPDPEPPEDEPNEHDLWGRPRAREEPSHEAPAVLGTFPLQDALLIAGRLRAEGIEAMAERDYESNYPLPFLNKLVSVLVRADQLDEARRLLQSGIAAE
jgi:hypothetical protein